MSKKWHDVTLSAVERHGRPSIIEGFDFSLS